MPIEHVDGAPSRGPSKAAVEKAFQFKLDKESTRERLLNRQKEIKAEMADIVEKERIGKAMLEKITDQAAKEKLGKVAGEQGAEWGRRLVALREELTGIEKSMAAKGIKSEEQSLN